MSKKNTLSSYLLLLIPITLLVIGQISTKYGSLLLNEASPETFFFRFNPYIAFGYSCLVIRGIVWVFFLRKIELSVAYPFLSTSFVIILIFSYYLFGEQIPPKSHRHFFYYCRGYFNWPLKYPRNKMIYYFSLLLMIVFTVLAQLLIPKGTLQFQETGSFRKIVRLFCSSFIIIGFF